MLVGFSYRSHSLYDLRLLKAVCSARVGVLKVDQLFDQSASLATDRYILDVFRTSFPVSIGVMVATWWLVEW